MGMCAVTICCPCMCVCASSAASIPSCFAPWIVLYRGWLLLALASIIVGFGTYIDLTFKCQAVSGPYLGQEPVNGTGVWVNASTFEGFQYARSIYNPPPGSARSGEVLINATLRDLGYGKKAWSISPLAYQGAPCWSEGNSAYFLQGLLCSLMLSVGAGMMLISLIVALVKKGGGTCCGHPIERPQSQQQQEQLLNAPVVIGEIDETAS
eukprot:TRINITY_DN14905_c0_g4_i2.p1 TRINITY_DN14905_c0_g4~~TRINITY_DN14905_c0_g4_i2.p1  ORF type:complete len:209 (+),score=11.16 TRINITY_DN14905_c0_g4_i2:80-706(+)